MATMRLEKGSQLDGFTIGDIAHRGGMAIFYEVTHPDHPIPSLMNVPMMRGGEDHAAIVGFEMEMMILPRLTGPHVPRFVAAIGADRVTCHVLEAIDPAEALVQYARQNNVDHMILGASAVSRLRQFLGSVASTVAAEAPCTVTVVRQRQDQDQTAGVVR